MLKRTVLVFILFGLIVLSACREDENDDVVSELVSQYDAGASGPTEEIWRYRYRGRTVYYFPPKCCDIPSILLDEMGETLCSPDGGLTGSGDGKCPDFFEKRRSGKLVWSAEGEDSTR